MQTAYNVTLQFSESGKIAKLLAHNGRIIAELYVEGPLIIAASNAIRDLPIVKGRVNMYRGDVVPLENNEFIDVEKEKIEVR